MISVVDASVFAYALLGDLAHGDEPLLALSKADEIHVPDLFFAELSHTVWKLVTARDLNARVVTYDERLRKKFSADTIRPADYLK